MLLKHTNLLLTPAILHGMVKVTTGVGRCIDMEKDSKSIDYKTLDDLAVTLRFLQEKRSQNAITFEDGIRITGAFNQFLYKADKLNPLEKTVSAAQMLDVLKVLHPDLANELLKIRPELR